MNTTLICITILYILVIILSILVSKTKYLIIDMTDRKLLSNRIFYSKNKAAYYAYNFNFENFEIIKAK